MLCDQAQQWLNARADGELPDDAAAGLQAHLADCSRCSSVAERLPLIDGELRRAFAERRQAPARVAERTISALRASDNRSTITASGRPLSIRPWAQTLLAMAAGFLLAVILFRPWQKHSEAFDLEPQRPVAHLALASGPIEVQPASELQTFTCPTGGPIGRDSIIRTGPGSRCEIALDDGNALQLDCNTEIALRKPEIVEVVRGRLCATSLPGRKLEIQSAGGSVVAKPAAQVAFECKPLESRVIAVDGTVSVQTADKSIEILPRQEVRIVQGKLQEAPDWCDPSLETSWVSSVLALRNTEHPELVARVNQLLANVGAAKLSLMYEDELRRLGDDGVPPLLAYLNSTRENPRFGERVTAARIVADVAGQRWIPDLIGLLSDPNAEVRSHAARGLERLTGRDQGCDAQDWQSKPLAACQSAYDNWISWWAQNRDRYPAARREVPGPNAAGKNSDEGQ